MVGGINLYSHITSSNYWCQQYELLISSLCPRPLGRGIKRCFCLMSDVWRLSVAYIGPNSRIERLRKTKIGIEVAHVTQVKRSKVKVTRPLYSAFTITREAGAAVTVRTYWAWETTAMLRLLGGARGTGAPTGEERGGGISCRHAHSLFRISDVTKSNFCYR